MDLFEKVFEKFALWKKYKEIKKRASHEVLFEDEAASLTALCCLTSEDPYLLVKPGRTIGFVTPGTIYLPYKCNYLDNKEVNRKIYLHKALVAGIILKYKLVYSDEDLDPRAFIFKKLQEYLPNYNFFYQDLKAYFPHDETPLWCHLLSPKKNLLNETTTELSAQDKSQFSQGSEVEGKTNPDTEMVSLEKERGKENPVSHSFEKLETADEYRGGYKTTDASDEIVEHNSALDELDIKKVTREGSGTQSIYKSTATDFLNNVILKSKKPRLDNFKYYPEWDYKNKELIKSFCRLYLINIKDSESSDQNNFIETLHNKYHSEINFWQGRLWSIINQRKNVNNQWEGSEIDIDAFIRYSADNKITGETNPRLYIKNLIKKREFTSLILFDQSLSTDSWVANKRVLDLELESIGLISILLKDLREPLMVASTWSETRNHCYFQTYKDFLSPWSDFINQTSKIEPQGYTRLGPSIRHAAHLLAKTGAKNKLLILLTDGKPTDFDKYEGRYGIEDIQHAILECKQKGVIVKALAIDKIARYYFPLLFGTRDYQILSDPSQLSEKLFQIYLETQAVEGLL